MAIQLTEDVTWIGESYPLGDRHAHVSVYLVSDGETNVLVDSGSFYHRERIEEQLAAVTGGEPVDSLILSHADLPHSGNVPAFREQWPDLELVSSSGSPDVVGLGDADIHCKIGGRMEINGRDFSFIDPPLADIQHTTWVYDHGSGVLFTADGFGSYHDPADAGLTAGQLPDGIPTAEIRRYHRDALRWLCYVEPAKIAPAIDAPFEQYDVSVVAPTHGHPIEASALPRYRDRLLDAIDQTSREDPLEA
jgi:flavorubredoxin